MGQLWQIPGYDDTTMVLGFGSKFRHCGSILARSRVWWNHNGSKSWIQILAFPGQSWKVPGYDDNTMAGQFWQVPRYDDTTMVPRIESKFWQVLKYDDTTMVPAIQYKFRHCWINSGKFLDMMTPQWFGEMYPNSGSAGSILEGSKVWCYHNGCRNWIQILAV